MPILVSYAQNTMHANVKDMTGKVFSRLTVIERDGSKMDGQATWLCKCECGTSVSVIGRSLRFGITKSCGCLRNEISTGRCYEMSKKSTKHGCSGRRTPEYVAWQNMHSRCRDLSYYEHYGSRGIKVCDRWHDFGNFLSDMGEKPSAKHSIDRINNDGHYSPDNCRWATWSEQNTNKRPKGKRQERLFILFRILSMAGISVGKPNIFSIR